MNKPEFIIENVTYKILEDWQTDHKILTIRSDVVIINNKMSCHLVDFHILSDNREKKRKKKEKKKKKTCILSESWKSCGTNANINYSWCIKNNAQEFGKELESYGNQMNNLEQIDYFIFESG